MARNIGSSPMENDRPQVYLLFVHFRSPHYRSFMTKWSRIDNSSWSSNSFINSDVIIDVT